MQLVCKVVYFTYLQDVNNLFIYIYTEGYSYNHYTPFTKYQQDIPVIRLKDGLNISFSPQTLVTLDLLPLEAKDLFATFAPTILAAPTRR